MDKKNMYCIWVLTGQEENYVKEMQPILDSENCSLKGTLHVLKKQMRLKNGKEYTELFFPGYVFFETEESEPVKLQPLTKGSGFVKILPQTTQAQFLSDSDQNIINSILKFGSTIGIVHVDFNEDDKIVILDGPFKDFSGKVVAVNRRNKRINIELEIMNGVRMVGLTYEEVKRV